MHFFTDFDLLSTQNQSDAFGAVGNSSFNYRVLNIFTSSSDSNAYAICDGIGFIQENLNNNDTVNFVFKPDKQLFADCPNIKYFIYRGILKNTFLTSNGEILPDNPSENSDLLNRMWQVKNLRNIEKQQQDPSYQPNGLTRSDLGLNENGEPLIDGTFPIDKVFFFNNFQKIKEGDSIGKFVSEGFALEVVLDTNYKLKYNDIRYTDHIINVNSSFPSLESLNIKLEREKILSYLDFSALIGLCFNKIKITIKNSDGNSSEISGDQYIQIIDKLANNNTIYIDIRNEYNYSLNFFNNYSSNNNFAFIGTPNLSPYHDGNGWPIVKISSLISDSNNTKQKLELSFPLGDNSNPICFLNKCVLFENYPNNKEKFIIPDNYIEIGSPKFSNNVLLPYYINLSYCRRYDISQLPPVPSNPTRYFKDNFLDNLFIINSSEFENETNSVIFDSASILFYNGWTSLTGFDFLSKNGIAKDDIGTTFYVFIVNPIELNGMRSETSTFYELNLNSGKKKGNSFYKFLQDQLKYVTLTPYDIISGSNSYKNFLAHSVVDNTFNNIQSYSADNLMSCSITTEELDSLNLFYDNFNKDCTVHIVLLDYNLNEDISDFPYFDFTIGLQGIKENGQISIENTNIKVYSTNGRIFMSENYAIELESLI